MTNTHPTLRCQQYGIRRKEASNLLLGAMLLCTSVFSQDIYEVDTIGNTTGNNRETVALPQPIQKSTLPRERVYAFPTIKRNNGQTIAGATMFLTGIGLEWLVIAPWSSRLNNTIAQSDTISEETGKEALMLLLASMPVGMLQISGASISCAGASRLRGTYQELVSPDIEKIRVWIPYVIGWIGRGVGGALGFIGGLSNSSELITIASYTSLGGEIAWTTSTIMSLVYSSRWRKEARHRLTVTPGYSPRYGANMSLKLSF